MKVHYIDSSAWVKRHFQETGSEAVNALFRVPVEAACCGLGLVEMLATIARKCSQASVARPVVEAMIGNVRSDFAQFRVVAVDDARIAAAGELALRHRLRAMDAMHLSCALSLGPAGETVMVSADLELLAAAARDGMTVLNPAAP